MRRQGAATMVNAAVLAGALLVALLVGEVVARAAAPEGHTRLGWAHEANVSYEQDVRDTTATVRHVRVAYGEHGFKRWPDATDGKKRVLIIGDSFTDMPFVSNGEEWYAYLEAAFPDVAFFVHGVGGYGTTQEYLALDEFIDVVQPDMIIWQFYFNDFSNNYYPADRKEYPLNSRSRKPYVEQGEVVYRVPTPLGWWREQSAIVDAAMRIYDRWAFERAASQGDAFYEQLYGERFWARNFSQAALWDGDFAAAHAATDDVFAAVRERADDTPIYLFSADDRLRDAEMRISRRHNITYVRGVSSAITRADADGLEPRVANDSHWNLRGNAIVGEFLVAYFADAGVFS